MVTPLLLVVAASAIAGTGFLKGGKSKKFFDVTKGIVGDMMVGAGAGAFMNYIDGNFLNGTFQKYNTSMIGLGTGAKGQNLNGTDALLALGTVGLGLSKQTLKRFVPFLAGKKIGEYTGAIDPIETVSSGGSFVVADSGSAFNQGVRT